MDKKIKRGMEIVRKYAPKYLSPIALASALQKCADSRDEMIKILRKTVLQKNSLRMMRRPNRVSFYI